MPGPRPLPEDTFANASSQPISASAPLALVPTWVPWASASVLPETGPAGSGDGGDGVAFGVLASTPKAVFMPDNSAIALGDASASADQANHALVDQNAHEFAGIGGNGGLSFGLGLHAGNGGNGVFAGALVAAEVGVFAPVNTAVAGGPDAHAEAFQSNAAAFLQGGTQLAGVGGSGGPSYLADPSGGSLTVNGDLHGGAGGAGTFIGTMTDISVAIYSPINIAVAGAGGAAYATQDNNVLMSQGATQIAGVGGSGGGFHVPSDTVVTGSHGDGTGGGGTAVGSLVDVNVAYYEPMNIAVSAGGSAEAQQIDHVLLDQHTLQLGGIGGDAGTYHLLDPVETAQLHDALHLAGS